jgi:hypothetical protein
MAPNTALGFILVSFIGFLFPYSHKKYIGILIQILTFGVLVISIMGLVVYSLKLEFIFSWYSYTRMAMHTAIGFFIISFAWWKLWTNTDWYKTFYAGREDKKIIFVTALLLFCVSMIVGLGGITWLTYNNIGVIENSLQNSLRLKTDTIYNSIFISQDRIKEAVKNPLLVDIIQNDRALSMNHLQMNNYFNSKIFQAIELTNNQGKILYKQGEIINDPAISIEVNPENSLHLNCQVLIGFLIIIMASETRVKLSCACHRPIIPPYVFQPDLCKAPSLPVKPRKINYYP